jgi:hypothetical protein
MKSSRRITRNSRTRPLTKRRSKQRQDYVSLEPRHLLAGDVVAFEIDGNLYIRGDAGDNQIQVALNDQGRMEVSSLDDTTINGLNESYLVQNSATADGATGMSNFLGGLRVHLGAGHDTFNVVDAEFEDLSVVYGGAGNDSVSVEDSRFTQPITVQTFDGDDEVKLADSIFDTSVFVFSLDGDDAIMLDDIQTLDSSDAVFVTGNDHDHVQVNGGDLDGLTQLILTLDGNDVVEINNPNVGDAGLGVFTGDGSDHLTGELTSSPVDGNVMLSGQGGSDMGDVDMGNEQSTMIDMIGFESEGQLVYNNRAGGPADVYYASPSYRIAGNDKLLNSSEFQLSNSATINRIEWTGSYNLDEAYATDEFVIEIFEGDEFSPLGDSIAKFEVGDEVDRFETGKEFEIDEAMYGYSATIDFDAEADTTYWISIYSTKQNISAPNEPSSWGNTWQWGLSNYYSYYYEGIDFPTDIVTVYSYPGSENNTPRGWEVVDGGIMDFVLYS